MLKEKIVRYGKFINANNVVDECVAIIRYDDILKYNYKTNTFDKIGENIHDVYRVRGGLNYVKKYGITICDRYSSIQALMDDDILTYNNLKFEFYTPVEI